MRNFALPFTRNARRDMYALLLIFGDGSRCISKREKKDLAARNFRQRYGVDCSAATGSTNDGFGGGGGGGCVGLQDAVRSASATPLPTLTSEG